MLSLSKILFSKTIKNLNSEITRFKKNYTDELKKNRELSIINENQKIRQKNLISLLKIHTKFNGHLHSVNEVQGNNIFNFPSSGIIQGFSESNETYRLEFIENFLINYQITGEMFYLIDFYLCGRTPEGKGFGTIAMKEIIEIAKNTKCNFIWGKLSFEDVRNQNRTDIEKKERLFAFYSKFNFEIKEYNDKSKSIYGEIKLTLGE